MCNKSMQDTLTLCRAVTTLLDACASAPFTARVQAPPWARSWRWWLRVSRLQARWRRPPAWRPPRPGKPARSDRGSSPSRREVLLDQPAQLRSTTSGFDPLDLKGAAIIEPAVKAVRDGRRRAIDRMRDVPVHVEKVAEATREACANITARGPEHDQHSACHVLHRVVTNTFNDRTSTRVAPAEALARAAGRQQRARGCAVEARVTDNGSVGCNKPVTRLRCDRD